MSMFFYYSLEIYSIWINILYKLLQLLIGQLTHGNILICLIFSHFSAIFAQITIFLKCTQTMSTVPYHWQQESIPCLFFCSSFFLIFAVPYSAPPIPVRLQSFWQNPVEWNQILVNSTELQTEIELK